MFEPATTLFTVYNLYVVLVVIFLLLDNRETSSTFAWVTAMVLLPVVGLIAYILFGRNWRRRRRDRVRSWQFQQEQLRLSLSSLLKRQDALIAMVRRHARSERVDKLLSLLYNNSQSLLTVHNSIELLETGKEKFRRLEADLRRAQHFIHMEYFIWRDDQVTQRIKRVLIDKAKKGVEVRILYDALGGFLLSRTYKKELRQAGVHIYPYFNFLSPFRLHTLNYRNHRKIAIIDGIIGYTGGMNMGEEYVTGGRFPSWHDMHLRISGEAVSALQGIFAVSWHNTTKERIFSDPYFPATHEKSMAPIQITTSGPDSEWPSIGQLYIAMLMSARSHVYIQTPYFIPDQTLASVLRTAALSGVDVRIMMTGVPDKYLPFWAAHTYMRELVHAGVRFYQYTKGMMHAKTVTVDGELCSIGTANMDTRSLILNYELSTLIYDGKTAQTLERYFKRDLTHCKEFTIEDAEHMPFPARLRNSVARLFAPLL